MARNFLRLRDQLKAKLKIVIFKSRINSKEFFVIINPFLINLEDMV